MPIKLKAEKNTYCKKCGSPIDDEIKKCTGCGKQYFKLNKALFVIILCIVLACSASANVYLYRQTQSLSYSVELNRKTASDLYNVNNGLHYELNFWENHAVIVTTEGNKYHHYGCGHIQDREFYIYNTEQAESLGYTPCLDCCGK